MAAILQASATTVLGDQPGVVELGISSTPQAEAARSLQSGKLISTHAHGCRMAMYALALPVGEMHAMVAEAISSTQDSDKREASATEPNTLPCILIILIADK